MNTITQLLFNPAIVSLLAGYVVYSFNKILTLPSKLVDSISIYLIFAIGFKGGACLGLAHECTPPLLGLAALGIIVGFLQPFIHYALLKKSTQLDNATAGVVAAEYGSISIVTFITALTFLQEHGITYDRFLTVIAGLMEIPALFSGLLLINNYNSSLQQQGSGATFAEIARAVFGSIKIMIIFVGFFVGYLLRDFSGSSIHQLLLAPFTLFLVLFMFDMGCKIAAQREHIAHINSTLVLFGIFVPMCNGIIGVVLAHLFVASIGSQVLFAVLLASASYIAVPAVMSTQAPEAKEGVYLPLSLGITLPFNILVGIPLYYYVAQFFV